MRKMIVELKIILEVNSDEDIELADIMDDAEYDFYSNLAEITALEQSYEVLDSK